MGVKVCSIVDVDRRKDSLINILVYLRTDLLMRHFVRGVDTFAFQALALA